MFDNNEEIVFENLLGEPETTRPGEIILGASDSSTSGKGSDTCDGDTCVKNCDDCTSNCDDCTSNCPADCTSDCEKVCTNDCGDNCTVHCGAQCSTDGTSCPLDGSFCSTECVSDFCGNDCANYGYICSPDADCSNNCGGNCPSNCTNYGTGTTSYYFRYYVGFRVYLNGTYSISSGMAYGLKNFPFSAGLQTSIGNVTFPFYYLGYNWIKTQLVTSTTQNSPYITVYKSGMTTFKGTSTKNAYICGVTIATTASTTHPHGKSLSGRLKYIVSKTHAARTYVPISAFCLVVRTTSSTPSTNSDGLAWGLSRSGSTTAYIYEKPISIVVTDNRNASYRLGGARIDITTNSGGLIGNRFYTGNYGYIRLFTSGTTATSCNINVSRSGYSSVARSISFHSTSSDPMNSLSQADTNISLSIDNYWVPNSRILLQGVKAYGVATEGSIQCKTASQLLNDLNYSAVTGSIGTQTIFTGNTLLRFHDVKSLKNDRNYQHDDYLEGKGNIFYYNPGVKTTTGLHNYTTITTLTYTCSYFKMEVPSIAISSTTANIGKFQIVFRMQANNSVYGYCYHYALPAEVQYPVIDKQLVSFEPSMWAWNQSITALQLSFAITAISDESPNSSITAKTISNSYRIEYYTSQGSSSGGTTPGGDVG